jgi:hypothetical protein
MRCCRGFGDAGAGAVRFVHVEPRCCCGGHGRSTRTWALLVHRRPGP